MRNAPQRGSPTVDARPLALPLALAGMPVAWWVALCVLILNDHALKGAGLLPTALTGKLSDFAGLVVAPLLLCAALRVRTERGRGLAFLVVCGAFAALKLSPPLAHAVGAWLTRAGLRSRLWCDPTDLLALCVVPWAMGLARALNDRRPAWVTPRQGARWGRRLGLAVAALACTATSSAGPVQTRLSPPFVINWTRTPIDVEITTSTFPCGGRPGDGDQGAAAGAGAATVGTTHTQTLPPRQLYVLVDPVPDAGTAPQCGEALLRAAGAGAVRVSWSADAATVLEKTLHEGFDSFGAGRAWEIEGDDAWAFERAVTLSGAASAPSFVVGGALVREANP